MRLSHYIELDKKMKTLRSNAGLSQKDMAAKLGLSVPSYSNYENGYSEPPVETLQKFCEILNINLGDLLGFNVSSNNKANLRTYSDVLRLIIALKRAGLPINCSVNANKESKRLVATINIESPQMFSMLSGYNELNDSLEEDKIDSDEYNICIDDLMSMFNIPIEPY